MTISLEQYEDYLRSWEGVPYRDCGFNHQGVDCLRFAVRIMDWLHGWNSYRLPAPPKLPKQTSLHDARKAAKVVEWVKSRYPNQRVWRRGDGPGTFKPGDFLVLRNQVNPGHAVIYGARPGSCWHSYNDPSLPTNGNVHETNLHWCYTTGILEVFRPTTSLLHVP